MLFFKRLFQTPGGELEAGALYRCLAERARQPILFTRYGVPDTMDGRFETLSLHAYALFHGLKGKGPEADVLSQALYDAMFADLDGSLREMGVADLGVGRRIKTMTEALNGRIQAYDRGFAADDPELAAAVRRNVYGTVTPSDDQVAWMVQYLRGLRAACVTATFAEIRSGAVMASLPDPAAMLERIDAGR